MDIIFIDTCHSWLNTPNWKKSTETFQLLARHSLVPYCTLDGMGYNVSQAFIQCIVESMNWVDVSVWAQFIFGKKKKKSYLSRYSSSNCGDKKGMTNVNQWILGNI